MVDANVELKAEFFVGSDGSQDFLGEFIVRHDSSQDLMGEFIVRHDGSQDLKAGFGLQKSVALLAEFVVRQADSQDLLGNMVVRHSASVELKASFDGQVSLNLLGYFKTSIQPIGRPLLCYFTVLQGSANLKAGFICKNLSSVDLPSKVRVSIDTATIPLKAIFQISEGHDTEDLRAGFYVKQGYARLKAEFFVGYDASQDLVAGFMSRQPSSADLLALLEVGQGSAELSASFFTRQDSTDLKADFTAAQFASEELLAEFTVRQSGSQDLLAVFTVGQNNENLFGELVVQQPGSQNLLGWFTVRHLTEAYQIIVEDTFNAWLNYWERIGTGWLADPIGDEDATEKASGQNSYRLYIGSSKVGSESLTFGWARDTYSNLKDTGSGEIPSEFIVIHSETFDLPASFTVLRGYENLPASMKVTTPDSEELPAEFMVRQAGSQDLLAELVVRQSTSRELKAGFTSAWLTGSGNLLGEFISRQADTLELKGSFWTPGHTVSLLAGFTVRQTSSRELKASFDSQATENLLAEFIVQQATARNLLGSFVVRHSTAGGIVIADDNLDTWVTHWQRVGTGFISLPVVEEDAVNVASGTISLLVDTSYLRDEAEVLIFGWGPAGKERISSPKSVNLRCSFDIS